MKRKLDAESKMILFVCAGNIIVMLLILAAVSKGA